MIQCKVKGVKRKWIKRCASATAIVISYSLQAQDGNAGLQQANTMVRGYFDNGTLLMYAVGAMIAIIGAVKVYQKWNSGDQDTGKVAAALVRFVHFPGGGDHRDQKFLRIVKTMCHGEQRVRDQQRHQCADHF